MQRVLVTLMFFRLVHRDYDEPSRAREPTVFEIQNLSRVPGDAYRYSIEISPCRPVATHPQYHQLWTRLMPLSDMLTCPESELAKIITSDEPYSSGRWLQAKNIAMIQLSKLGEILNLGTYKELSAGFELVGEPLPDGPWPERTPPALVAAIAALTDDEIQTVARAWSNDPELEGNAPGILAAYLSDFRGFASDCSLPIFLVNAL
ncbi:hypothetical protein SAMN06265222_12515 [Neorhodopirellula lusitana]|uniref:Uncharacterized protein n=2 Tax=Neorhodopirellula lusitana TaxID=445327 RepID=A0ABY1QR73_9BACT|nr:hypothetical protein SAMN06265222_12515 [Neorhodopirellula lusitana]